MQLLPLESGEKRRADKHLKDDMEQQLLSRSETCKTATLAAIDATLMTS